MSAEVTVRVDNGDGTTEDVVLNLDLDRFTMRESVRLEELLGVETFNSLVSGGLREGDAMSPRIVQALLYVKLKTIRPDVTVDAFDVELEDLQTALTGAPAPLGEPSGDGSKP